MRLDDLNEMAMQYPGQALAGFWKHGWYCLYDTQKAAFAAETDDEFEDVIIGGINIIDIIDKEEYKVNSIAAEKGYGPILYYFAMTKGYLRSDLTVSSDAQKIWYTFANMERHNKNVSKKESAWAGGRGWPAIGSLPRGKLFQYAYTITGPLRFKTIAYMKQAKTNHQLFRKWISANISNRLPDEIETLILEGTQSYVNSKL